VKTKRLVSTFARVAKDFLFPRPSKFVLEAGEQVVAQIDASRSGGSFIGGPAWRPLLLTNKRLLWKPPGFLFFDKPVDVHLSDIQEVDQGKRRDWLRLYSSPRIGIRLTNGKRFILTCGYRVKSEMESFFTKLKDSIPQR
jgi:hypothetical protein